MIFSLNFIQRKTYPEKVFSFFFVRKLLKVLFPFVRTRSRKSSSIRKSVKAAHYKNYSLGHLSLQAQLL